MKKPMKEAVLLTFLLGFIIFIACALPGCDRQEIRDRMTRNGINVISIDSKLFNYGPYYYLKNTRVYEVYTDKGTFWVRFGTWSGPNIHQQIEGTYQEQTW